MIRPKAPAAEAPASSIDEILLFEQLLAELSAGFVNLPAARTDDAITDALRRSAGLLGVERCNLIRFSPGDEAYVTHSWSVADLPAVVRRSISDDFPWGLRRIPEDHAVRVPRGRSENFGRADARCTGLSEQLAGPS